MKVLAPIKKPSKLDQSVAAESYNELATLLGQIHSEQPEIEIEETGNKVRIPFSALQLLTDILMAMSEGKSISIVPFATELTTQAAAEMLGCSRPHIVKLLEEGKITFTKVGKHRKIKWDDLMQYKQQMKVQQKQNLIAIMNADEKTGFYDS